MLKNVSNLTDIGLTIFGTSRKYVILLHLDLSILGVQTQKSVYLNEMRSMALAM